MKAMGYAQQVIESISFNTSNGVLSWIGKKSGVNSGSGSFSIKDVKVRNSGYADGAGNSDSLGGFAAKTYAKKDDPESERRCKSLKMQTITPYIDPVVQYYGNKHVLIYDDTTKLVQATTRSISDFFSTSSVVVTYDIKRGAIESVDNKLFTSGYSLYPNLKCWIGYRGSSGKVYIYNNALGSVNITMCTIRYQVGVGGAISQHTFNMADLKIASGDTEEVTSRTPGSSFPVNATNFTFQTITGNITFNRMNTVF